MSITIVCDGCKKKLSERDDIFCEDCYKSLEKENARLQEKIEHLEELLQTVRDSE